MSEEFKNFYRDDDDDVIAPDVAPKDKQPISPADAVHLEQEKYGETTANENREDEWDEHHGTVDDIV